MGWPFTDLWQTWEDGVVSRVFCIEHVKHETSVKHPGDNVK